MAAQNQPTPSSTIPSLSDTLIDDGSLLFLERLGAGSFGQVYKAIATSSTYDNPTFFAVKVMIKYEADSVPSKCQALEISIHQAVADHPNIVSIHKVFSDDSFVYVVMDLCTGGTLGSAMKANAFFGNDALMKKTFIQLIEAVQHCHKSGFAHRDLKPENILVDKDGEHIFLADFGSSTPRVKSRQFAIGTHEFMSPEGLGPQDKSNLANATPYSTRANDVWSLGILLITMLTGQYSSTWNTATSEDARFQQYMQQPEWLDSCLTEVSNDVLRILKRMLDPDQETRIGLEELKQEVSDIPAFFHAGRGKGATRTEVEEVGEADMGAAPCIEQVKFEKKIEMKPKRIVRIQRRVAILIRNKAL